jgi:hypothetical protein
MVANQIDRHHSASWLFVVVLFVAAGTCRAQEADRAIEFEDLGLTNPGDASSRGAGLAAFVPVAGDAAALIYNPAGLCRIKKRTGQIGLAYDTRETVTRYGARSMGLSSDRYAPVFIGAAFPIPTFRGALVPAIAVHRMFVSDLDIAYEGDNSLDGRADSFRFQQSGSTYALALGFGIDLASVLSAGLSFSAFEGGYTSLRQSRSRESTTTPVDRYAIDDVEGDLDGVVGRIGVTLFVHRHVHVAVNVTTPTVVNNATTETNEITEVVENGTGSTVRTSIATSSEYLVPYRLDGGIEIPVGDWLLVAQAGTCDWSQAAIDGRSLRLQTGNAVLGRTVDARAGVEWTSPWWPVRLRAGAARLPFAPEYMQADRVDNDRLEAVLTESSPRRYSFGAAIALGQTIFIDASYSRTTGDRGSTSFSEERTSSQILIEGSYWF